MHIVLQIHLYIEGAQNTQQSSNSVTKLPQFLNGILPSNTLVFVGDVAQIWHSGLWERWLKGPL